MSSNRRAAPLGVWDRLAPNCSDADLEECVLIDDGGPVGLPDPAPRELRQCGLIGLVERRGCAESASHRAERIELVGLVISPGLREHDELVVWRDMVCGFRVVTGGVGQMGRDRKIRILRRDLVVAHSDVPPELVLADVAADIGVEVVVSREAIGMTRRQPAATAPRSIWPASMLNACHALFS